MFNEIDFQSWDRKEIFEIFSPCIYYITTEIDITEFYDHLKAKNLRFYPTINYCISKVINQNKAFRFAYLDGKIGYFDIVHPFYTTLRKNTDHLFTHKLTKYNENFNEFYAQFLIDIDLAENCDRLYYDKDLGEDKICISITPLLSFKSIAFNSSLEIGGSYVPFITIGKFFRNSEGRLILPVAGEFHHEVNDGYHSSLFFNELEKVCRSFNY